MEESKTVNERVAAGAAFLDGERPGWERAIDLSTLDLKQACRCIIGQLYGSYYSAAHNLFGCGDSKARDLGFMGPRDDSLIPASEWAELDEAWITLIKERFDSGLLSDS